MAAEFNAKAMNQASEMKALKQELSDKDPSVADLGKFDPDDFDAHKDAFLNLLAQSCGVLCEPLRYGVQLLTWVSSIPMTLTRTKMRS